MATPSEKSLTQLLDLVEHIRMHRAADHRDLFSGGQVKRFSQQELNDSVYPTYKNLLIGRSHRLPSREKLMDIADYLECSVAERNDLLVCGGYLPIAQEPAGEQLRNLVEFASTVSNAIQLPMMVVTRDWHVHYSNALYNALFGLPPLDTLPMPQRNALTRMFDPALSMRSRYSFSLQNWQQASNSNLQYFRDYNRIYRHEPWYRQVVKHGYSLPGFTAAWNEIRTGEEHVYQVGCALGADHAVGHMLGVHMTFSKHFYPTLWAYVPIDEAATHVFQTLGCQLEQVRWLTG